MKRTKFQGFDAGRAGQGRINLFNGQYEFEHMDMNEDSFKLPLRIDHVYNYGEKNWKLNLNQTLLKVSKLPTETDEQYAANTKHILTYANGNQENFEEKYYYIIGGARVYTKQTGAELKREDITVKADGSLSFEENGVTHKIKTKLISDGGNVLHIGFQGFKDASKLETRHEDIVNTEEEIFQLEKAIEELKYNHAEYEKIESQTYKDIVSLQNSIEAAALALETSSMAQYNALKPKQTALNAEKGKYFSQTKKEFKNVGGFSYKSGTKYDNFNNLTFSFDPHGFAWTYVDKDGQWADHLKYNLTYNASEIYNNEEVKNGNSSYNPKRYVMPLKIQQAQAYYQQQFENKVNPIINTLETLSREIEQQTFNNQNALSEQKQALLDSQVTLNGKKTLYENTEKESLKARYKYLKAIAEIETTKYENKVEYKKWFLNEILYHSIPEKLVLTKNKLIFGYNHYGQLCYIADSSENELKIAYDNNRISQITDDDGKSIVVRYGDNSEIESITDAKERKIRFEYRADTRYLSKIIYADGDSSTYNYNGAGYLNGMWSPCGIGKELRFQNGSIANRIFDSSFAEKISASGLVEKHRPTILDNYYTNDITIEYGSLQTAVTDLSKDTKIIYCFNSQGVPLFECAKEDNEFRSITAYEADDEKAHCDFVFTRTSNENNILEGRTPIINDPSLVTVENESILITGGSAASFAFYSVNAVDLCGASDSEYILYAQATAQSALTSERRITKYCMHQNGSYSPLFELTARVFYNEEGTNCDLFAASYDWQNTSAQLGALPITLREDAEGTVIIPKFMFLYLSYENNQGVAKFQKPVLAKGDWVYTMYDAEHNKTAEYFSECIVEKVQNGSVGGHFVTRSHKEYNYDENNSLMTEKLYLSEYETNAANNLHAIPSSARVYATAYEYDKQGNPIRVTDSDGNVQASVRDEFGHVNKTCVYNKSDPSAKFYSEKEMADNGKIIVEYDESGLNATRFNYENGMNAVSRITAPGGARTAFVYDPYTDAQVAVSSDANGEPNSTACTYVKGVLVALKSGNTAINFEFDKWGRKTKILIDGQDYASYEYTTDEATKNQTAVVTYCQISDGITVDGEKFETIKDKSGKVKEVFYTDKSGERKPYIKNTYSSDGKSRLLRTDDIQSNKYVLYTYSTKGALLSVDNGEITTSTCQDVNGNTVSLQHSGSVNEIYSYAYDANDRLTETTLPNGAKTETTYDVFGRVRTTRHPVSKTEVTFCQYGDHATSRVSSLYRKTGGQTDRLKYTYDVRGNITEVHENGGLTARYEYDALNRLVREDNTKLGESQTFEYDGNGNILYKGVYGFTLKEPENGTLTRLNYDGDKLTSADGKSCEYDALGNPQTYLGKTLTWERARLLHSYDGIGFEYDASGNRTKKANAETVTQYVRVGDRLLCEIRTAVKTSLDDYTSIGRSGQIGGIELHYLYNGNDAIGVTVKRNAIEQTYYYGKNAQGDVTHIHSASGELMAKYVYDAWGNHKTIAVENGEEIDITLNKGYDSIANLNPLRYFLLMENINYNFKFIGALSVIGRNPKERVVFC